MGIKIAPEVLSKTTYEQKIYNWDFSADMATGETITALDSTAVSPTGPTLASGSYSGQTAQITVSGGTADIRYLLTAKVTTSTGEKLEGSGYLWIRSN